LREKKGADERKKRKLRRGEGCRYVFEASGKKKWEAWGS